MATQTTTSIQNRSTLIDAVTVCHGSTHQSACTQIYRKIYTQVTHTHTRAHIDNPSTKHKATAYHHTYINEIPHWCFPVPVAAFVTSPRLVSLVVLLLRPVRWVAGVHVGQVVVPEPSGLEVPTQESKPQRGTKIHSVSPSLP